jgi:transcriptional regulator with XRE-family HTH domain
MRTAKRINSFRKHRLLSGLSREQAAEMLEISESYLEKIENDFRLPGRDLIIKMATLYTCKIDSLCLAE